MQDTPDRGKRIGVCKQCLKKKIAEQIQRLLTQVFTGGIIFPGLLSPKAALCGSEHLRRLSHTGEELGGSDWSRSIVPHKRSVISLGLS